MKRMTPEEAREWRARSVAGYQASRSYHQRQLDVEMQEPEFAAEYTRARKRLLKRAEKPQEGSQRARKAAEAAEYRRNREQRLVRARGRCEFLVNPDMPTSRCTAPATQTHHVVRRSHNLDHSVENLLACCGTHHALIHRNVEWAKAHGYIRTDWPQIDNGEHGA